MVEGGNHSLEVGVRTLRARGESQDGVDDAILDAVRAFLREHVGLGEVPGPRPRR